jgi:hypothetical protein
MGRTRRVDDLVQAMGLTDISKSTVSKLCRDIDERVPDLLDRSPATGLNSGSARPARETSWRRAACRQEALSGQPMKTLPLEASARFFRSSRIT